MPSYLAVHETGGQFSSHGGGSFRKLIVSNPKHHSDQSEKHSTLTHPAKSRDMGVSPAGSPSQLIEPTSQFCSPSWGRKIIVIGTLWRKNGLPLNLSFLPQTTSASLLPMRLQIVHLLLSLLLVSFLSAYAEVPRKRLLTAETNQGALTKGPPRARINIVIHESNDSSPVRQKQYDQGLESLKKNFMGEDSYSYIIAFHELKNLPKNSYWVKASPDAPAQIAGRIQVLLAELGCKSNQLEVDFIVNTHGSDGKGGNSQKGGFHFQLAKNEPDKDLANHELHKEDFRRLFEQIKGCDFQAYLQNCYGANAHNMLENLYREVTPDEDECFSAVFASQFDSLTIPDRRSMGTVHKASSKSNAHPSLLEALYLSAQFQTLGNANDDLAKQQYLSPAEHDAFTLYRIYLRSNKEIVDQTKSSLAPWQIEEFNLFLAYKIDDLKSSGAYLSLDTILKSREVIEKLPAFKARKNDKVYELVMDSSRFLRRRATAEILKAAEPSLIGNLDKVDDYVTTHARELEWKPINQNIQQKRGLFSTMQSLLETVNDSSTSPVGVRRYQHAYNQEKEKYDDLPNRDADNLLLLASSILARQKIEEIIPFIAQDIGGVKPPMVVNRIIGTRLAETGSWGNAGAPELKDRYAVLPSLKKAILQAQEE